MSVYPQTRGNDRLLVSYYYEVFEGIREEDTFFDVMGKTLTNFETIRRARQKIQETNIELRADADIEAMRMAEQRGYLEFVGSTI